MARPPEFDHDQVLRNAMILFWRKGYEATSVKDLIQATALQPGSLYGAFKNKRLLFLKALDYYFAELYASVYQVLFAEAPPLERIHRFFQYLLNDSMQDEERKGCLLVNTLLEIPTEDREINQRVAHMLLTVERALCTVLQEAQAKGALALDKNPEILARTLISGIFGMRVYHRMKPSNEALQTIVNQLLTILK